MLDMRQSFKHPYKTYNLRDELMMLMQLLETMTNEMQTVMQIKCQ